MPLIIKTGGLSARSFGLNSSGKVKFAKQEYTTAGSYTFTVPPGNTSLIITASGGGAAGQISYFGGPWGQSNGAAGGNTTVTNSVFNITANGGVGGYNSAAGGTVSITGAISTTLNQTGNVPSGGTGGSSYYGSGASGPGGNFSKPATPTYSAGGGAGFQNSGGSPPPPDNYGGSSGGTGIIVVSVTPGQIINITVGAGATGGSANYNKGGSYGSYAGDGGVGYAAIEMA